MLSGSWQGCGRWKLPWKWQSQSKWVVPPRLPGVNVGELRSSKSSTPAESWRLHWSHSSARTRLAFVCHGVFWSDEAFKGSGNNTSDHAFRRQRTMTMTHSWRLRWRISRPVWPRRCWLCTHSGRPGSAWCRWCPGTPLHPAAPLHRRSAGMEGGNKCRSTKVFLEIQLKENITSEKNKQTNRVLWLHPPPHYLH